MRDVVFTVVVILFFLLSAAYARGCERF